MFLFHKKEIQKPTFIYFAGEEMAHESLDGGTCSADSCKLEIKDAEKDIGEMMNYFAGREFQMEKKNLASNVVSYEFQKNGEDVLSVNYNSLSGNYDVMDHLPNGALRRIAQVQKVDDLDDFVLKALSGNASKVAGEQIKNMFGDNVKCKVRQEGDMTFFTFDLGGGKDFWIAQNAPMGYEAPVYSYVENSPAGSVSKESSTDVRDIIGAVRHDHEKIMVAGGREKKRR